MPQPVAEVEHASPIVARQRLLVLVEIGRILHVERQPPLGRGRDMPSGRRLQRAEIARERALRIVGQLLIVEHQHGVVIHAGLDRRDILTRQRLRDVHARHLAGELRMDRADAECHDLFS